MTNLRFVNLWDVWECQKRCYSNISFGIQIFDETSDISKGNVRSDVRSVRCHVSVRCLCFFCVLQIEDLLCIRSLYTKGQDKSPICYCGFSSHYILKGCMAYKSQICHKGSVRCLTNLRFVSQ